MGANPDGKRCPRSDSNARYSLERVADKCPFCEGARREPTEIQHECLSCGESCFRWEQLFHAELVAEKWQP